MTNAELLAKIKAEIDRLYGEYKDKFHQCGDQYHLGLIDGLDMAERVLDSLESEHLADARKTLEIKPGDEVTINGHKIVYDKDKGYVTIVKSEESVPNDLEEAAEEYLQKVKAGFLRTLEHPTAKDCFKDGAKWQKEHDADLIEIAYNDGITIGMTKQKEQIMKAAVEGEICIPNVWVEHKEGKELVVRAEISKELGFKFGEKVRIIIVKEDKS